MKSKREVFNINDFSNGLLTTPNQHIVAKEQLQNSPDCLNVYTEGPTLRSRNGVTKVNSSSAGTAGNGLYNWVLNASNQYLVALFDTTLKKMSTSGNTWSGTWATVSADTGGSAFSSSIMHFVTYQGTLIMTTENRDKPQRITPTDTKYKNLDYAGTGSAPLAKFPQIWKEHVFLLNISGGGQLTEDCGSLSGWTTLDVSVGTTSTSSFGGLQSFKFLAGAVAGSDAHIKRTLTSLTTSYSIEMKTYFASISNVTGGDYAYMDVANGIIRFRTRWSQDGLEVYNGAAWIEVGVNTVSTGTWNTWKFLVSAGTAASATVDVFKDSSVAGLQFSVANASTASSGQLDLAVNAGGSSSIGTWYMDYIYINPIASRTNYFTDGFFNTWVGTTQATYTDNVLPAVTPYTQYKCEDNTSNSTVTDAGSGSNNGAASNSASTINSSLISTATGKVTRGFSLTAASGHNISLPAGFITAVKADTVGSFAMWVYPQAPVSTTRTLFSVSSSGAANSYFYLHLDTAGLPVLSVTSGGAVVLDVSYAATVATGSWSHIAVCQNGTAGPNVYVNNSLAVPTYYTSTDKAAWIASVGGTVETALIGAFKALAIPITLFFQGTVDDFRYYRSSISSSEVQSLYADGGGNQGLPVTVREGTTIYTGTYSYRVNNNGEYAVVSQTLASSGSVSGLALYFGAFVNATNLSTYKLRVNDGTMNYDSPILTANGTWQYQSLSFTPMSSSTAVRAQVISLSSSTLFWDLVGIVDASTGVTQDLSDRIQRSLSGTYDTWTGGDSGYNDITTPGDVGLTGSFVLQDRLYVMKAWNIYRVTYTASIPLLDIKQARSVVGTKSPRSIKSVDLAGVGEVVIFLGTDRNLYIFDGFSSSSLTDGVQLNNGLASVYFNNVNSQALDKIWAVNHSNLGWYEIFLPIGDATMPNYSIIYNYKTKAFFPFSNRSYSCGNISDDASGQRVVMMLGGTNGYMYEFNSDKAVYSDDGTAINAYWTSFKLGEDYVLNRIDEFSIATDAVNATPSFAWRCNYETAYTTKVLKANTNKHNFTPERIDNLVQFKISNNSTSPSFKIWSVKALERAVGIGT